MLTDDNFTVLDGSLYNMWTRSGLLQKGKSILEQTINLVSSYSL